MTCNIETTDDCPQAITYTRYDIYEQVVRIASEYSATHSI